MGTVQWNAHSPKVGRHHRPPTIAHYNNHSTLQWQPTMALAWCHVQSAKVVRRPPPFLEVRTAYSYIAIWGKMKKQKTTIPINQSSRFL